MSKTATAELGFIKIEDLEKCVQGVVEAIQKNEAKQAGSLYKNGIDPFSAIFDSKIHGLTMKKWLQLELARQHQKTLQNAIGQFHQDVLGSIHGWENLGVGKIIDLRNKDKKIIAEIKNKYNTTKGNHKKTIYDDLKEQLKEKGSEYVAYYVEIIPKTKKPYNKVFVPSDNVTHTRRPINEKIRVIDGKSFYTLITGDEHALEKLYYMIPHIIDKILGNRTDYADLVQDGSHKDLFDRIY